MTINDAMQVLPWLEPGQTIFIQHGAAKSLAEDFEATSAKWLRPVRDVLRDMEDEKQIVMLFGVRIRTSAP